ncbi:hypothetical protein NG861_00050 [Enterococcus faecalis]|uniref:hypothetical protein n=1 Tax=Enterococcus faecalis TaxID=1351 RepID=UPI00208FFE93|nr:hypothetical protein [Enterococcus faecalis]MCO5486733.1 hypothetical protein [Enterococcus faecalis]HDT8180685.1 hypothetical protein [Enterococcus faecalis]
MRSPLTLTLLPIAWNSIVWLYTFSTFNPSYKTNFSIKKLAIMNLCAGGLGGILAGVQLHIKSIKLWTCFIIGGILDGIVIYFIIRLLVNPIK